MILKPVTVKPPKVTRYNPHAGRAERRRRLKQIAAGHLKGDFVSIGARYAAIGLTDPTEIYMLKDAK